MAVAVVDTGVLVGRVDVEDDNHRAAKEIVEGIDHGDLPTGRVSNYVVLETLNWIHSRKRHRKAVQTYESIKESAGFEVVHAAQKDFTSASDLFETYDQFSFGDATIAAYMKRADVEYLYSFDDDFDVLDDITRLETPDNPFK